MEALAICNKENVTMSNALWRIQTAALYCMAEAQGGRGHSLRRLACL